MGIVVRSAVIGAALIIVTACATLDPPSEPDSEMGYLLAELRKEGTSSRMALVLEGEESQQLRISEDEGLRLFEVVPGTYRAATIVCGRTDYSIGRDPRLATPLVVESGTIVYLGEWLVRSDGRDGRLAIDSIHNYAAHHLASVNDNFPAFARLARDIYFPGEENIRLDALEADEFAFRTAASAIEPLETTPFSRAVATADLLTAFRLLGVASGPDGVELMHRFFGSLPSTAAPNPLVAEAALGGYLDDGQPLRMFARLGPREASTPYDGAVTAVTVGSNAVVARDGHTPGTRRAIWTRTGFVDAYDATWVIFGNGQIVPVDVLEAREHAKRVLRSEASLPQDALNAAMVLLRDQSPENDRLVGALLSRLNDAGDLDPAIRAQALHLAVVFFAVRGDLDAAESMLGRLSETAPSPDADRIGDHGRAVVDLVREASNPNR
ncbi:MAG: hypothetical protein ACOCW3_01905 [Spirochaetota bacterium]